MKTGFVVTNFNNTSFTEALVESVLNMGNSLDCTVIVDNLSNLEEIQKLRDLHARYPELNVIYNDSNIGYFPGLNIGISYLLEKFGELDFVVVGNNDLVFPSDFCGNLAKFIGYTSGKPVISPNLITLDGIHQNPHVVDKISPLREFIWDIYYSNYFVSRLIHNVANLTRRFTERKDYLEHDKAQYIYQGYGACYILTPDFFKHFKELLAPVFLMGEELFLTKQLETIGSRVYYEPSIVVYHHDHATVSKMPSRNLWEISKNSHKEYRKYVGYFNSQSKK